MSAHPVMIRAAEPDDVRFVMDSWLSSHRHSYHVRGIDGPVYYKEQRAVCEVLLQRGLVLMAVDSQAPSSIFGWMVCEVIDNLLVIHFLYIRGGFQDHGLGTKLVKEVLRLEPDVAALVYTHQTKAGRKWAEKMSARMPDGPNGQKLPVIYNPFFLYRTLGAHWQ